MPTRSLHNQKPFDFGECRIRNKHCGIGIAATALPSNLTMRVYQIWAENVWLAQSLVFDRGILRLRRLFCTDSVVLAYALSWPAALRNKTKVVEGCRALQSAV